MDPISASQVRRERERKRERERERERVLIFEEEDGERGKIVLISQRETGKGEDPFI